MKYIIWIVIIVVAGFLGRYMYKQTLINKLVLKAKNEGFPEMDKAYFKTFTLKKLRTALKDWNTIMARRRI